MRIDVFCESGEKYGLGHLRRCENLTTLLISLFAPLQFEVTFHTLPCKLANKTYDLVIIDSYITQKEIYRFLSCHAKALLCLDDLGLHYPKNSFVLSPTFAKSKFKFCGKDYIILNPVFQSPPLSKTQKNHIFISLGGSNQNALLLSILSSLPKHFTPHILSPTFPNSYTSLLPQEICQLIDSCEYVICSGGGTLNEAISRHKKIIALCIAPNQKKQLQAYIGKFPILFNPFKELKAKLNSLLSQEISPFYLNFGSKIPSLLQAFVYQGLRLPSNIKPFFALNAKEKKQVLHLRNQKEVREASFHSSIISYAQHLSFLHSLPYRILYFAFFERKTLFGVGMLKITHPKEATLGIYKDITHQGGGKKILYSLFEIAKILGITQINLEVLRTNTRAISFYQKHHFTITQEKPHYLLMQITLKERE